MKNSLSRYRGLSQWLFLVARNHGHCPHKHPCWARTNRNQVYLDRHKVRAAELAQDRWLRRNIQALLESSRGTLGLAQTLPAALHCIVIFSFLSVGIVSGLTTSSQKSCTQVFHGELMRWFVFNCGQQGACIAVGSMNTELIGS